MTIIGPLLIGHVWVLVCVSAGLLINGRLLWERPGIFGTHNIQTIYLWMVDYYADRLDLYNTKTQLA